MTEVEIPINEKPFKTEEVGLKIMGAQLIDGYLKLVDGKLLLYKRPGLGSSVLDLETNASVDGLFYWLNPNCYIAVSDSKVFRIDITAGVYSKTLIGQDSVNLPAGNKVIFAERGNELLGFTLLMAAGKKICYTEVRTEANQVTGTDSLIYTCIKNHKSSASTKPVTGVDYATYWTQAGSVGGTWLTDTVYYKVGGTLEVIDDPDAPQEVSHVCYLDQYIIANKIGSGEAQYTEVGNYLGWSALDYERAESDPDLLIAVISGNQRLYLIGERTTEIWYNDGVNPWSRYVTLPHGTSAKYSPIMIDGMLYLLNQERKVVRIIENSAEIISGPFDDFIQEFETVSDAESLNIIPEGEGFLVMNFAAEDRSIFYDYKNDVWGEWGSWNGSPTEALAYNRFIARSYAYSQTSALNLCGSRLADGKIYNLSKNNFMDNSNKVRTLKRSGWVNGGTSKRKRNQYLEFDLRRGYGLADERTTAGKCLIRWRDNGNQIWSNEKEIDLGAIGDYNSIKRLLRTGMYNKRQYEIIHSDNGPFILAGIKEEVEVMDR